MLPRQLHPVPQAGFTMVELIIVMVLIGILSVYAAARSVSTAEVTLPSQAQKLASDIRHAQALAYTSGKRMRFTIVTAGANGTYDVTCVTGPTPCNTDFSVALQKGVTLAGPATLDFTSLGQPSGGASYTLTSGSSVTVSVAALTGFVTVSL